MQHVDRYFVAEDDGTLAERWFAGWQNSTRRLAGVAGELKARSFVVYDEQHWKQFKSLSSSRSS